MISLICRKEAFKEASFLLYYITVIAVIGLWKTDFCKSHAFKEIAFVFMGNEESE